MKSALVALLVGSSAVLLPVMAQAQWLGPTLDAQRWSRLNKHQQEQRRKAQERRRDNGTAATSASVNSSPLNLAERQKAWNSNKAEYQKRLLRDGKSSADRWLDQVALADRGAR
jgi:hypothetical protein